MCQKAYEEQGRSGSVFGNESEYLCDAINNEGNEGRFLKLSLVEFTQCNVTSFNLILSSSFVVVDIVHEVALKIQ